ncbi:hypothetical protein [Spiroplasma endosymbiont of Asaphidion curtum]|uniref:hypothetical protein n=1 Tax=Spiroplasma endosymbiont of Asaphidion curtum TaxID=3066281 RepID=UPI00313DFA7C
MTVNLKEFNWEQIKQTFWDLFIQITTVLWLRYFNLVYLDTNWFLIIICRIFFEIRYYLISLKQL